MSNYNSIYTGAQIDAGIGFTQTHTGEADPHAGYVLQSDLATEVDALVTPMVASPSITLSGATIGVNRLWGRVTADLTNVATSSTTLTDVTGLSVTVEAGATYELRGVLIYACTTVAQAKVGWTVPASSSGSWTLLGMNSSSTANTSSSARWQSQEWGSTNIVGGTTTTGSLGTTANRIVSHLSGVLITTAAGSVTLRAAQNVSEATALQVGANSYIMLTRIA